MLTKISVDGITITLAADAASGFYIFFKNIHINRVINVDFTQLYVYVLYYKT